MFFLLSKILGVLIDPLVIIVALLIFGLVIKGKRRFFLATGIILLLFFSNPFIINQILKKWEPQQESVNCFSHKKYEYGIVLTGMLNYQTTTGQVNFLRSSDRIWQAVRLYKQGIIQKIFISGGAVGLIYKDTIESAYLKNYLVNLGIAKTDILTEETSRNTYENALYTCSILKRDSILPEKCLLITSAIHMRRAAGCFAKQNYKVDQFAVDHYSGSAQNLVSAILLPNINAIWQWSALLHEWVGFISYKISGYL